jgi:hypothetical protein
LFASQNWRKSDAKDLSRITILWGAVSSQHAGHTHTRKPDCQGDTKHFCATNVFLNYEQTYFACRYPGQTPEVGLLYWPERTKRLSSFGLKPFTQSIVQNGFGRERIVSASDERQRAKTANQRLNPPIQPRWQCRTLPRIFMLALSSSELVSMTRLVMALLAQFSSPAPPCTQTHRSYANQRVA